MTDPVARAALERAIDEKDLLLVNQPIFEAEEPHLESQPAI